MRVLAVASDGTAGEHAGVTVFVCVDVELDSECVIFLSMIIIALKTSPPHPPRRAPAHYGGVHVWLQDDDNTRPDWALPH